jgi:hypothetical protein
MNFKINLDFCVIPSPYNKGAKNLVFISYRGANKIDEKLCLEADYEHLKNTLGQYGYQEIDFCIFESSDNTIIRADILKSKLSEAGLRYSKPFEFNIMGELDSFNLELMSQQEEAYNLKSESSVYFSTTTPIINSVKSKIPAVGEKIVLHFYLFLQCHWINENDCVLELVGDLYSKENNNTRNFLQITKSEFVRLDSNIPNTIMLQSVKSYGDFTNEINILHKGNFKFVKPIMSQDGDMVMKTKEFVYNIIEVKKSINPIHRIVVEANLNQYYDNMISVSKKIKKELSLEQKKIVSLEVVRPEMLLLKQKLKDKMLILAETDEFEKASIVKKDMNFIDNKIKSIDDMEEKNITYGEYFKTFCLNS